MKEVINIAIVGLGYVGLPLFCLLSRHFACIGMDEDKIRVTQLKKGIDNRECEKQYNIKLALQRNTLTSIYSDLAGCNTFIICVPTGIDKQKKPNLEPLKNVCKSLGKILKRGDIVIFESTVFPGATEDVCVPILEEFSAMKVNKDFSVGYSPERINVGDKFHRIESIPKIISASNMNSLSLMNEIYSTALDAPIVKASSIKVAEASKMYENVQRDVLIALANEYADFCKSEGINIGEVTECAASKWNFTKVNPGLVGGHCIGVDTYYLLQRAKEKKQPLALVQTARSINEAEPKKVASRIEVVAQTINAKRILLLGFSYKADTPDCRNTKAADVYNELKKHFPVVDCFDPIVDRKEIDKDYGICVIGSKEELSTDYDLVVNMVNHNVFSKMEFADSKLIKLNDLL
ncbi:MULTISPECIES: nucleotide sugar dehydrogenase [Bacteroides]|uniref:nucleotide sugar dehydrogenase n=1 Tax=Bacteroides TaxID=816 RepID=UPI00187AF714|nr:MULTISPECIES: nucleotide sugar dehydrogenase [Bacteroides]MBE7398664.1 nucleotide sugar dehydrogenase [Bacteroides fragilis]MBV4189831.1 nucleotide sugar dehydrogenase [Bacteroides fragilis]MDV6192621.1 nucleotide sugar dehydrogenase [Bacteroides hominis (ex Liu et al. 2022)]